MRAGGGRANVITGCVNKVFDVWNKSSENTPALPAHQIKYLLEGQQLKKL